MVDLVLNKYTLFEIGKCGDRAYCPLIDCYFEIIFVGQKSSGERLLVFKCHGKVLFRFIINCFDRIDLVECAIANNRFPEEFYFQLFSNEIYAKGETDIAEDIIRIKYRRWVTNEVLYG